MNRRKYIASLGLVGVGGYATYNTTSQPVLSANIELNDDITIPTVIEEEKSFNTKLSLTEFTLEPQNINTSLETIQVHAKI